MPDTTRIICTRCKQSVYNCMIDGVRVPIVHRMNLGQPADTGPTLAINDPGVKLTSYTRSMMQTSVARIELCEKCFADVLGLPLLTADADPMFDEDQVAAQQAINRVRDQEGVSYADAFHAMHTRAIHAFAVGWGEASVDDLAGLFRKAPPIPKKVPSPDATGESVATESPATNG